MAAAEDTLVEKPPITSTLSSKGVLRIVLNRPEKRNCLSEETLAALQETFDNAKQDTKVRVIILASTGPAFSSGHDLKQMSARRSDPDRGRAYFSHVMATCSRLMQTIVHHPRPVVAEVTGVAAAAGCQLAASCDLVIASPNAQFMTPGVNIGLFCHTPMVALSRAVSRKHAMEMLLTGEMISAERAREFGLVNRIVEESSLTAETNALAEKIASKSAYTVRIGKEAFYRQAEMTLEDAYGYAAEVMVENMLARDAEEGIGAFIEKRDPVWSDE